MKSVGSSWDPTGFFIHASCSSVAGWGDERSVAGAERAFSAKRESSECVTRTHFLRAQSSSARHARASRRPQSSLKSL